MDRSPDPDLQFPRLLEGVTYPVERDELLERAIAIDAPISIQEALGRLRPGMYRSRDELVDAIELLTRTPEEDDD